MIIIVKPHSSEQNNFFDILIYEATNASRNPLLTFSETEVII